MKKIILFFFLMIGIVVQAQDGKLLTQYVPQNIFTSIDAVARLSDGSLIVGGTANNGQLDVVKLNSNGQLAGGFNVTFFDNMNINSLINTIYVHSDGSIYVGGRFTTDNANYKSVVKLTSTGTYVSSFVVNLPLFFQTTKIMLQPGSNKLLICGGESDPATVHRGIYRLNSNGSFDTTFNPGQEGVLGTMNLIVHDMEIYANGDIIIGGFFNNYNDTPRENFAKLNANGSLQSVDLITNSWDIEDLAIQPDGKILMVGVDDNFNPLIRRYNTNLTIDSSFQFTGTSGYYSYIQLQDDGKIITGGNLTNIGKNDITRLNSNGSFDNCFDTTIATGNGSYAINDVIIESDGNILAWGSFPSYDNVARPGLAKVRGQTTINAVNDTGMAPQGTNFTSVTNVLINDNLNGFVISSGSVTLSFVSSTHSGITLNTITGSVNVASTVPVGTYSLTYKICESIVGCECDTATVQITVVPPLASGERADSFVRESGLQSNDKIIISGYFNNYNNTPTNTIARLNPDFSLDTSFNSSGPLGLNIGTDTFVIQPDDYIVVGGTFEGYSGQTGGLNIARLKPDGSYDYDFYTGSGFKYYGGQYATVYSLALQQDGKILVGGGFDNYDGIPILCMARLNTDGTLDSSFNPGNIQGPPLGIVVQPDGYILKAGFMSPLGPGGSSYIGVVRLTPNGSLDPSFYIGTGVYPATFDGDSHNLILQPDGKIIFYGTFTKYNGQSYGRIVRLNTDGTIDSSFEIGSGFNNKVFTVKLDQNGRLIVGGEFTYFNGQAVTQIVRLNPDGSLDTTFDPGTGPSFSLNSNFTGRVMTLTVQPDDKVIIGGDFKKFDDFYAGNITRLIPDYGVQARPGAATDIFEEAAQGVTLYPNPGNGIFNLQVDDYDGEAFELEVYNALGQLILKSNLSGQSVYQIDLSTVETGNYFVRMQNSNTVINKIIAVKR